MFYQIFISPQVKQSAIMSNKLGTYDLPLELPIDLRLRTLEKLERFGNSKNFIEHPVFLSKKKLEVLAKNCCKVETKTFQYFAISREN